MTSTFIESGNRVRVYDAAVQTHDDLPEGTWVVRFSPLEGFSLQRVDDLAVGEETVYGGRGRKIAKIFRSYQAAERSFGVMLSGDKGIGKSMFLRMIAEQAASEHLPIVRVTEDFDGLADFIDTLGECLVVFDEFEKVFPRSGSGRRGSEEATDSNRQNQFLSLFDGTSAVKRLYCVTVNDIMDVSAYLVNRPGRFHYHMRFEYPGAEEIREYLAAQAPDSSSLQREAVVAFSHRVNLNYDQLRAIAFELTAEGPDAEFAELIADLNIKAVEPSKYLVTATYKDGSVVTGTERLDLFASSGKRHTLYLRGGKQYCYFSFANEDLVHGDDGEITLPRKAIEMIHDEEEAERPKTVTMSLMGQATYAYGAF